MLFDFSSPTSFPSLAGLGEQITHVGTKVPVSEGVKFHFHDLNVVAILPFKRLFLKAML